jgi:hypothetical protein
VVRGLWCGRFLFDPMKCILSETLAITAKILGWKPNLISRTSVNSNYQFLWSFLSHPLRLSLGIVEVASVLPVHLPDENLSIYTVVV